MDAICILAAVYLACVLALTLPYWYETGNAPCEDIPAPPWSWRAVLRLWLEGAWGGLLLGAAFVLAPLFRLWEKKKQAAPGEMLPPVLLVHGLYHNPSGWFYLRRHLERAGFCDIRTLAYSSWGTDMPALTAALESAVRETENAFPGKKPLLIGHSLGGLVIRNWLAAAPNQARARGVITLGSPHRGSKMAALAFGNLGRSLVPANPFFADLARTEAPASIPCLALVSEADTMVLPQENLVPVTKGWAMRTTPYATHIGLLTKGAVARMLVWELHRMLNAAEVAPAEAAPAATAPAEPVKPEPQKAEAAAPQTPPAATAEAATAEAATALAETAQAETAEAETAEAETAEVETPSAASALPEAVPAESVAPAAVTAPAEPAAPEAPAPVAAAVPAKSVPEAAPAGTALPEAAPAPDDPKPSGSKAGQQLPEKNSPARSDRAGSGQGAARKKKNAGSRKKGG